MNKPAIRFAGFTDAWEQRKLGEIVSLRGRIGFRGYTQADLVDAGEGAITFSPADINDAGYISLTDNKYISWSKYEESPEIKVQVGDILFTKTASIGKVGFVRELKEKATINPQFALLTPNGKTDGYFTFLSIRTDEFMKKVRDITGGSSVPTMSQERLKELTFMAPSLSEQKNIGSFFANLNNLITLHQREYAKLVNIKASMLEKMFPKEGSAYPEVRSAGFTDAWEQRKFSDITFPAGEKNKDNLPLESYSITNEHGFVPQDEKFENGGTMREADKRMYYIVSPNSFAYNPARINVGSIGYQNIGKNVIVSSLYEVFKTSEDVDDRLLWHWFKSPDFQKLIMQLQEGGVRLYFYYDKLCMGEVSLPSLEEQRKIGKLFDTLDHLITLHQRKLEKLQNIKKSMLEKMFV